MSPSFDPMVPFDDLPPLPPHGEIETRRVLKAAIRAREQLATLNTACRLIPNPTIITSTIPLREAKASTEIENIVTTNDELFRASQGIDTAPTAEAKETLRYNEALHLGNRSLTERPLSVRTAIDVCSALQNAPVSIRSTPGTYIGDRRSNTRTYTPPSGAETIQRHLSSWERFIYTDHDLDPLVLMAVLHYQFEAIHPFHDGNGRTGRILNILLLIQEGILELPVLYLSGIIVRRKEEYYDRLLAVTSQGSWEEWILFMLQAVEEAARESSDLINDLRAMEESMSTRLREECSIAPAKELAELLFTLPYIRIRDIEAHGLARRQTASHWLTQLVDKGILEQAQADGRQKLFINRGALDILTRM
ncbi:Fic family protein [Corynebacterium kalidii]|uniref:Fic family protein n=1 Tax=Corynebacterium kalidii TaxID=2931982 RepID=A0A9X2AYF1_9CORY|nr:Fic/DOC family N-terminal domain-containing protein [Corynebacterium kalidii]MCJ7857487.1 Fic family protein [Corynebacterium kalidii]